MRKWNTKEDLIFLHQVLGLLHDKKRLEPAALHASTPLDLTGLQFPTVTECRSLGLPDGTTRVVGQQKFSDATILDVDFSRARLDFSVWDNCDFERIIFDRARLQNIRFFGCRFIDCTFRSTDLKNSSFSVGRNGSETQVISTRFEKSDFRGASCNNPIFRLTTFHNCRLDGFVFDSAMSDRVVFAGDYHELTFRGLPGELERNRLQIDLSEARLKWLNADDGIDLRLVKLPNDESCFILADRIRAIPYLVTKLRQTNSTASQQIAKSLTTLYSDESMCPLSDDQETLFLSKAMIADFAETTDARMIDNLFHLIRQLAVQGGFVISDAL